MSVSDSGRAGGVLSPSVGEPSASGCNGPLVSRSGAAAGGPDAAAPRSGALTPRATSVLNSPLSSWAERCSFSGCRSSPQDALKRKTSFHAGCRRCLKAVHGLESDVIVHA